VAAYEKWQSKYQRRRGGESSGESGVSGAGICAARSPCPIIAREKQREKWRMAAMAYGVAKSENGEMAAAAAAKISAKIAKGGENNQRKSVGGGKQETRLMKAYHLKNEMKWQ
jgi:hypothetical protein